MENVQAPTAVKKALWMWMIYFANMFTIVTITSSSFQLLAGQTEDTNAHILFRAVFVGIAATTIVLFRYVNFKKTWMQYLIPYAVAQGSVFIFIFMMDITIGVHPNAYFDAFTNFTGVAVLVMLGLYLIERHNKNKTA